MRRIIPARNAKYAEIAALKPNNRPKRPIFDHEKRLSGNFRTAFLMQFQYSR